MITNSLLMCYIHSEKLGSSFFLQARSPSFMFSILLADLAEGFGKFHMVI